MMVGIQCRSPDERSDIRGRSFRLRKPRIALRFIRATLADYNLSAAQKESLTEAGARVCELWQMAEPAEHAVEF
jgi:hypothetical protein